MKIKDVSERYGITADTLRYYERIGLIRNVRRNSAGIRDYSPENCETIEFLKCMRGANISIEGLTKYMDLYHQGDDTQSERKQILIAEREKLTQRMAAMQTALERLNHKIATYDDWTDGQCHQPSKKATPMRCCFFMYLMAPQVESLQLEYTCTNGRPQRRPYE